MEPSNMIINLSPTAYANIKRNAAEKGLNTQQHIEQLLEDMHEDNSCFYILKPIPHPLKVNAITHQINHIMQDFDVIEQDGLPTLQQKKTQSPDAEVQTTVEG